MSAAPLAERRVRAFAKINLSLEIIGRRSDGFHELVSVFETVSLHDTLQFQPAGELEFVAGSSGLQPDNLITRAAALLAGPAPSGVRITLDKSIPIAAGLGGGSSDAAATLTALNRWWGLGRTCHDLQSLAADLGSDVPFFLTGGRALVQGRGETVSPLPEAGARWYLLVNPGLLVSTATVFAALFPTEWSDGATTFGLAGRWPGQGSALGRNALEEPLFRVCPAARECFDTVRSIATGDVMMSGSGPTVIAACTSRDQAERIARKLRAYAWWTAVVHSVLPPPDATPCRA